MGRPVLVLAGAALIAVGRLGAAQSSSPVTELSVYAGGIAWDRPARVTTTAAGVRAGLVVLAGLSLEGYYDRSLTRPGGGFGDAAGETYGVSLVLNGPASERGDLFLVAGSGWGRGSYSGLRFGEFGVGARVLVSEIAAVRLDVRAFSTSELGRSRVNYRATVGMSWFLGGGWSRWPRPSRPE